MEVSEGDVVPSEAAQRSFPNVLLDFLKQRKLAAVCAIYLLALIGAAFLWPFISEHDPDRVSERQFLPPSAEHWCGTDVHGRDLLSRIFFGTRISLLVGIVGALVSLVIGVLWGAIAGYRGGRIDELMMRFVDILYSMPSVILVILLITTMETVLRSALQLISPELTRYVRLLFLFVGLGAVSWLTMARIVRGQVLSLRSRPFVEASRALGASHRHILVRHILPNISGVIIVYLMLTIPSVILYESFLSYLGLGVQAPQASWGTLIAEGARQINPIRIYWWLLAFPAGLLVVTLMALNFLGDALRELVDPLSAKRFDREK
jgi:peptide/nickel transport system permease protein/oligopeptide transport system permease protein